MDRCGDTIVRIRRHKKAWVPTNAINPQSGILANQEDRLQLLMGNEWVNLTTTDEEIELTKAERRARTLAEEAEKLTLLILDSLGIEETTRVGFRVQFFAPADSVENANYFVSQAAASPLGEEICRITKSVSRIADVTYVVEHEESGVRRRVQVVPITRIKPGMTQPTGLGCDEGTGGVMVDIDTFTRPETGNFRRINAFIQESYLDAAKHNAQLFGWIKEQLKRG
jgi:hypothetical protein